MKQAKTDKKIGELREVFDLLVPDWREAVEEVVSYFGSLKDDNESGSNKHGGGVLHVGEGEPVR